MTVELFIDSEIRLWVFLPIVLITFLIGILRHYVAILMFSQRVPNLGQIEDSQAIIRARLLRENGNYLTAHSFAMRKAFFNHEQTGYFKTQKRFPDLHPSTTHFMELIKSNFLNMVPMVIIGGWINWVFSGFVITKVPFPLTLRFKPMLQRGIELASLDASWVSSASWYILNVFGLRSVYALALGEDNHADQSNSQANFMAGAAITMPQDPEALLKAEWEALEFTEYYNELQNVDNDLLHRVLNEDQQTE